jgi:hypothetical protein
VSFINVLHVAHIDTRAEAKFRSGVRCAIRGFTTMRPLYTAESGCRYQSSGGTGQLRFASDMRHPRRPSGVKIRTGVL